VQESIVSHFIFFLFHLLLSLIHVQFNFKKRKEVCSEMNEKLKLFLHIHQNQFTQNFNVRDDHLWQHQDFCICSSIPYQINCSLGRPMDMAWFSISSMANRVSCVRVYEQSSCKQRIKLNQQPSLKK
jgi:hypothetical protein